MYIYTHTYTYNTMHLTRCCAGRGSSASQGTAAASSTRSAAVWRTIDRIAATTLNLIYYDVTIIMCCLFHSLSRGLEDDR